MFRMYNIMKKKFMIVNGLMNVPPKLSKFGTLAIRNLSHRMLIIFNTCPMYKKDLEPWVAMIQQNL